jgi:hypothetical protein
MHGLDQLQLIKACIFFVNYASVLPEVPLKSSSSIKFSVVTCLCLHSYQLLVHCNLILVGIVESLEFRLVIVVKLGIMAA